MHYVISIRRRVRACTRFLVATKALPTRDYVRDISRLLALSNKYSLPILSLIKGYLKLS
jgi:hypothetical protein